MVANHGLMRIFWPSDAPNNSIPGVIVGWRNSESDILVAGILQNVEPRNVDNALKVRILFRNTQYSIDRLLETCGNTELQVLGVVNPTAAVCTPFDKAAIICYTTPKSRFPQLAYPEDEDRLVQIIVFDRPHPTRMQYLSLDPILLALGDKTERGVSSGTLGFPPLDGIEAQEEKEWRRKQALVEKLQQHTVLRHPRTHKELMLPIIINQINCSWELNALLQSNLSLMGKRSRARAKSMSEKVVQTANNVWDAILIAIVHMFTVWIWPVLTQLFIYGLTAHRIAGEGLLFILDWRLFPGQAALKDVSATAQQVDIRLQQFCYWPLQYMTLRKRKQTWQSITNSHPEYIRFYNSLWLVANDVIIGIALGSYIIENATFVAAQMDRILTVWTIEGLQRTITWLMDYPAGLKLNTELAHFLGDLFLWVIDYWAGCMGMLRLFLPGIVQFIGFSSFAGATMPISLFSDLISILTLHIYSFYVASARIYNWQLSIIISLFHLFRGKKRNVLRNRIDSCDYDLDQLLLGTILFTLLFFLLPTVFVFYLTFASARMAIISLKAGLDTLLACLNHFPLFALMLRFKDSRRLPGGIRFELDTATASDSAAPSRHGDTAPSKHGDTAPQNPSPQHKTTATTTTRTTTTTSHIYLHSVPLPLSSMLNEYFQLGNRIRKHYVSPRVVLCLVTGRFVPPIHRKNLYSLQYSMLPAQRVGIRELWKRLNERLDGKGAAGSAAPNGWGGGNGAEKRIGNGFVGGRRR